jgi:hypothetical protein
MAYAINLGPCPPSSWHIHKKAREIRPRGGRLGRLGGGVGGGGLTGDAFAKDKYFVLTFSYIMGKAAN